MARTRFPPGCALLFGGVSGLGAALLKCFAEAETDLAIASDQLPDQGTAQQIEGLGRSVSFHYVDARDVGEVEAVIDQAIAAHGRVHTVVWAANDMAQQGGTLNSLQGDWTSLLDSGGRGLANVVKTVVPHFRKMGGGSFVVCFSKDWEEDTRTAGLAAALMATCDAMVQRIASDEGRYRIRANSIVIRPGEGEPHCREPASPTELPGLPEEVGHAAVFLASREAACITGQHITVSSGPRAC